MKSRSTLSIALVLLAAAAACHDGGDDTSQVEGAQTQGEDGIWSVTQWKDREAWYLTPQGSHLIDFGVFMALEEEGRARSFSARENLESFGLVYPPNIALSKLPDGLPLGVLRDRNEAEGQDYVGLSCPACHTGQMRVGGKRVVIEGGQAFFDLERFLTALSRSIDTTIADGPKKQRFCARLKDTARCDARLGAAKDRIDGIRSRNHVTVEDGPGRLDAISRILNEVFGDQVGGEKPGDVQVPVSFPAVWDAPRLSCVQTNCLATNSLTRNTGEVLGVFGHAVLSQGPTGVRITGTPKVENLATKLEHALESLPSPKWESLVGPLDRDRVRKGEALFERACASCHGEPYKAGAPDSAFVRETFRTAGAERTTTLWKVNTMPYRDVGTDPRFIEVHGARKVDSEVLEDVFDRALENKLLQINLESGDSEIFAALKAKAALPLAKVKQIHDGVRTIDGKVSSLLVLGAVTASVEASFLEDREPDATRREALRHEYEFNRKAQINADLAVYRARPLDGIAFTFPYGHNGAWPTLWDMLQRADKRPDSFVVRPGAFDPENVGLDTKPSKDKGREPFVFDTSRPGNSKAGHEYGTDLSDDEKRSLLEYLKSL